MEWLDQTEECPLSGWAGPELGRRVTQVIAWPVCGVRWQVSLTAGAPRVENDRRGKRLVGREHQTLVCAACQALFWHQGRLWLV